jgi:large subunit ribosomal protein L25
VATANLNLAVEKREKPGTTGSNALRHQGKIPAVLYGHGSQPESIAIDAHAFQELLHHGARNTIVTLQGQGRPNETALVRTLQYHPVSHRILHADFQRVSANESIVSMLDVVTTGVAPGVKDSGGVMDVVSHQLEIEGPASQIPENLEVDVSSLGLHDHVTAGDVKLPAGFTMVTPPETVVVTVEPSRTERQLEEAATGPAAAAEPEVIGASTEEK